MTDSIIYVPVKPKYQTYAQSTFLKIVKNIYRSEVMESILVQLRKMVSDHVSYLLLRNKYPPQCSGLKQQTL